MTHGRLHADFAGQFIDRRQLLRIGSLGSLGLSLPALFQAEAAAAARTPTTSAKPIRSCIFLFYYGGPSHLDTWDMKPNAPREIRGEFQSIATTVPGLRVCEHLPHCAKIAHRLAIVRSMHHPMRNHNAAAVEAHCGRTPAKGDLELLADDTLSYPSYGSALTYQFRERPTTLPHVALPHIMYNVVRLPGQTAGFLGAAFNSVQLEIDPTKPNFRVSELEVPAEMTLARLDNRQVLLRQVDRQVRAKAQLAKLADMDVFQKKAFGLISSEAVRRGFDLSRETDRTRDRYGRNILGQSLLLARRLVEAGVRFVNVNDKVHNGQDANWDSHELVFVRSKDHLLPPADQAFSALIEDLEARGLLDSTLVVAMGEFGRTPRVNKSAGRDHWPDCFSVVLAGGGLNGGSVVGSSDKIGAYPDLDPVSPGDLAATLFWRFGLDADSIINDTVGRPFHLAAGKPLTGLFHT